MKRYKALLPDVSQDPYLKLLIIIALVEAASWSLLILR